jgi:O-methyltransferase involved in polyketide biosynthesis
LGGARAFGPAGTAGLDFDEAGPENSAPGSTIVFDYMSERAVRGDHDDALLKQRLAQMARWGEPVMFGLPIGEARAFVERRGLTVVADLRPLEMRSRADT